MANTRPRPPRRVAGPRQARTRRTHRTTTANARAGGKTMTPSETESQTHVEMAVIVERLKHIQTSLEDMRSDLRAQNQQYLPRAEWEVWSTARDREIKEMKDKDKSKVAIWTGVGGFVVSLVLGVIVVVQAVA